MMIIVISNNAATNVPLIITAVLFELSFLLDDATV